MKTFRFFLAAACALALAGCNGSPKTAQMTPRIPVVNSHGIPGPENNHYKEVIFDHPVVVKDGWLQPWLDYDSLMVWSLLLGRRLGSS